MSLCPHLHLPFVCCLVGMDIGPRSWKLLCAMPVLQHQAPASAHSPLFLWVSAMVLVRLLGGLRGFSLCHQSLRLCHMIKKISSMQPSNQLSLISWVQWCHPGSLEMEDFPPADSRGESERYSEHQSGRLCDLCEGRCGGMKPGEKGPRSTSAGK